MTNENRSGWAAPVRISLPEWLRTIVGTEHGATAGRLVSRTATVLTTVIPATLALFGIVIAVVAAVLAEHETTEAVGSLGVEFGAAMWFAGAVALGARPRPTRLRVSLLIVTGLLGAALIGSALIGEWTGAALTLAMEFGVGAVAVVLLDVLILGLLQSGLDRLATGVPR